MSAVYGSQFAKENGTIPFLAESRRRNSHSNWEAQLQRAKNASGLKRLSAIFNSQFDNRNLND